MNEVTSYPPNTFAWIDLSTTDPEGAKHFYTELFGWEGDDVPLPMGGTYTMLRQDGKDVAGLGGMQPDAMAQGQPSAWSSYVSVDDADAMTERATRAGATVFVAPFDVMDQGRMAVLQDPTGAVVCLWQPLTHIGARIVNIPNSLVWNELLTGDTERAAQFYQEVFGWSAPPPEGEIVMDSYITFFNGERAAAGMMAMPEMMAGVPPHWSIYIAVDDLEKILARAQELGGRVLMPTTDTPLGSFAVLQDPQGASFNVMQMVDASPMP